MNLAPEPPLAPADARRIKREVALALALLFGGTGVLALLQLAVPAIAGATQLGLAILLFQIPERLLAKKIAPEGPAITFQIGPARAALALAGKAMLVVFPLFVLGFVGTYTLVLDRPVAFEASRLLRWGETLEWAPSAACGRAETLVWTQEDQLWIVPPNASHLRVQLAVGGHPVTAARTVLCRAPTSTASAAATANPAQPATGSAIQAGPDGTFVLPRGTGLWVQLGSDNDFALQLFDGPRLVPEGAIRLGATGATPSDDGRVDGARDLWWLLAAIVIHLGLVALPEEHFFRGYLLPRLDQICGRPRRLFGVPIGWGLILSSLAFALLHPILIPGPHRLLVFFPALLSGWLRAKSGKLGAPILVHAASNILLAIVSRMVG